VFTLPMRKARWRPTSLSPGMRLGFQARTARNPVSVHHSAEIRCQFIILALRDEPTPDYVN
jgi:hypothetical protein